MERRHVTLRDRAIQRSVGGERSVGGAATDSTEDAVISSAEEHLGPEAATEARGVGEGMTYREALAFAFEVCGVTGDWSPDLPEGFDDIPRTNPVLG